MERILDIYDITPEQAQIQIGKLQDQLFCAEDKLRTLEGEVCRWLDMSNSEMRLICGELTTQEIRTVKTVLNYICISKGIRSMERK